MFIDFQMTGWSSKTHLISTVRPAQIRPEIFYMIFFPTSLHMYSSNLCRSVEKSQQIDHAQHLTNLRKALFLQLSETENPNQSYS